MEHGFMWFGIAFACLQGAVTGFVLLQLIKKTGESIKTLNERIDERRTPAPDWHSETL